MKADFISALKAEVAPAFGCTEPTSVALATAHCKALLNQACTSIEVEVSTHLYKNAMGVFVPGTGMKGLVAAAAAGWVAGDKEAGLEVLHQVNDKHLSEILELHSSGLIQLTYCDQDDVLFTRVKATSLKQSCEITIEHTHTGITNKTLNGEIIYSAPPEKAISSSDFSNENWSLNQLLEFINGAPTEELEFIREAEILNRRLSEEGLKKEYGAAVGRTLQLQQQKGWLSDDLLNRVVRVSAAASDARMGGAPVAAMSNSGSGNQGIAATLPVSVAADWLKATDERRLRALALSHLIAIYCKQSQPKLSALCAVTTAAMGSAAAISWLLGASPEQVHASINNMAGDVSGMLCDGANAGCALKISSATASAVKAALMAQEECSVTGEGIVAQDADTSIANIGRLSREGLGEADRIVLTML